MNDLKKYLYQLCEDGWEYPHSASLILDALTTIFAGFSEADRNALLVNRSNYDKAISHLALALREAAEYAARASWLVGGLDAGMCPFCGGYIPSDGHEQYCPACGAVINDLFARRGKVIINRVSPQKAWSIRNALLENYPESRAQIESDFRDAELRGSYSDFVYKYLDMVYPADTHPQPAPYPIQSGVPLKKEFAAQLEEMRRSNSKTVAEVEHVYYACREDGDSLAIAQLQQEFPWFSHAILSEVVGLRFADERKAKKLYEEYLNSLVTDETIFSL